MALGKNESDIGPAYVLLAIILCVIIGAVLVISRVSGHSDTRMEVIEVVAILLLVLALVRPKPFDDVVKHVADWLPFLKFSKPPEG